MIERIAGALAIGSGLAYVAYLFTAAEGAISAWNVAIIPAALVLGVRTADRNAVVAAAATAAGVGASLLWAFFYQRPGLETWWIALATAWWLGLGWLLLPSRPGLARFTLVLALATAVDAVLTAANAPMPIYALGGFKIPLTILWTFWVAIVLVREAGQSLPPLTPGRGRGWAGAAAAVAGVLWAMLAVGWTLSHGSTDAPRGAPVIGLGARELTELLAVPSLLLAAGLAALAGRRRWLALAGAATIALGAVFQTSFVDTDRDFGHPLVQGGFLLFVFGLVPALSVGFLVLRGAPRRSSWLGAALTPLPVVAFALAPASDGSLAWEAGAALLHAAPGVGWSVFGLSLQPVGLWSDPAPEPTLAR